MGDLFAISFFSTSIKDLGEYKWCDIYSRISEISSFRDKNISQVINKKMIVIFEEGNGTIR